MLETPTPAPTRAYASFVLALALIVRLAFIASDGLDDTLPDSLADQIVYVDLARNLVTGHGIAVSWPIWTASPGPTALQPPLYPLILASSFQIFDIHYLPVRVFQAILGSLSAAICFTIAARTWSVTAGLIAGVGLALYPPMVMLTRPLMTETLVTFLLLLSVYACWHLRSRLTLTWSLGIGALVGLLLLTAPQWSILPGIPLFAAWWHHRSEVRRAALSLVAVGLAAVVVIAPWVVRNARVFDQIVVMPTKGGFALFNDTWLRYQMTVTPELARIPWGRGIEFQTIPNYEQMSEPERSQALTAVSLRFMREHPGVMARYAVGKVVNGLPLAPRELLPPPWGWRGDISEGKDTVVSLDKAAGITGMPGPELYVFQSPTSFDDYPRFQTWPERLRLWAFRAWFLLFCVGAVSLARTSARDREALLVIGLMFALTVAKMAIQAGTERHRAPADFCLILVGAAWLAAYGRTWMTASRNVAMHSNLAERRLEL